MTKNILIVNSAIINDFAKGELNNTLAETALATLKSMGHNVKITRVIDKYEPILEMDKFKWADIIIYQFPAWWMSFPWQFKKYIDEILLRDIAYTDDGRTRNDINKKYGSGGLFTSKLYMISTTWNAPIEAFDEEANFFEGKGVDAVYFHFHKTNQFIGMKSLPTFMLNDVIKNSSIEEFKSKYISHLKKYF